MPVEDILKFHKSFENYVTEALKFFDQFSWIFETSNNEILYRGVLTKIPKDWIDMDLNHAENFLDKEPCKDHSFPETFVKFAEKVEELTLAIPTFTSTDITSVPKDFRGLSSKKVHEVERLGAFIQILEQNGLTGVVDIGCGLGYIDRLLERSTQLKLLGVESNEYRTHAAIKVSKPEESRIRYRTLTLDGEGESLSLLEQSIDETFDLDKDRLCMLGLHACGDLSVRIFRTFARCQATDALIVLSCCYHRMVNEFPVSKYTKNRSSNLTNAFLRLAAQESWNQWRRQNKLQQAWNVFFRASLENFIRERNLTVVKRKRKPVGIKVAPELEDFLRLAIGAFDCAGWEEEFVEWAISQADCIGAIRTLCLLQARLQIVAEIFILVDRVLFLREEGYLPELWKLFNDSISARCIAVVCFKDKERFRCDLERFNNR